MIQLLILQLAAATVPPASAPTPGSGMENLPSLFSVDDYPAEAIRNGWQGDVTVELNVDVTGRPTSCRVVKSSAYPVLDMKTCEVMMTRARFQPAQDADGNPVADIVRFPPVTWRLPPQ